MTFASTSVGRTISRTGAILKRQWWIWPIIAVVLLAVIGWGVRAAVESTMKENLKSQLQTLLNVEVAMLETWFGVQASNVESAANGLQVRETVYQLLKAHTAPVSRDKPEVAAVDAIVQKLRTELAPMMSAHDYVGFMVTDKSKRIIAASTDELLDRHDINEFDTFLTSALDGKTTVSPPFPSISTMKDEMGRQRTGVPNMFVCAPVRDTSFQVVGALAMQIRPERQFTQILQLGRIGESGESYAFDKQGQMVSNSRFDNDLILLGLLPDRADSHSLLNLEIRDPGGDMTSGFRSKFRRSELPLTKMAASAVAGNAGVDVEGYGDYRGVPVVGAWTWLEKHRIGVTTEVDVWEAFRPLTILQWTFWGLFSLLAVSSVAIFVFTLIVARMQRDAQRAAIEAKQLGQYRLEEKLGAGAMGVVFKGRHAMLRRETAIKMLDVERVNDASIARFEREVQITCQLNNPHTVAIYDYGRTAEGVFYYAMEFLDGIDLQKLVEDYGPQPEARVIRILTQICGSLYEAHSQGLVHRDIKPANIMLNRRGGEPDVVKVLDFGLVKALGDDKRANMTSAGSLVGTPLYISPEAIQSPMGVDHCSDLYAVGAVGYFLLTGQPVFGADTIVELCRAHVDAVPEPPSKRLGKPVSRELESALLACLEKSRAKRPQTARDLAQLLAHAPTTSSWTIEEADAWWGRHERGESKTSPSKKSSTDSHQVAQTTVNNVAGTN